ncbi:hypothetical protein [Thermoactinospora rubra]|uniref:hypothetical protein n=1 Tax=Thermoactinospora rubra TaxID=1088767 RepID=UPI000A10A227|nr:hypothetical protein [Thermoactinospora rubra]
MTKVRAGLILALLVAAGCVLVALTREGDQERVRRQLADRVTAVLENASLAEHHAHGHGFTEKDGRIVCAVEVFGTDPADVASVAEVEWVYAHHMCAVTGAGGTWARSVRAAGPLAVRLGHHPQVRLPRSGANYREEIARIIPRRYHERAFEGFADTGVIEAARRRFGDR